MLQMRKSISSKEIPVGIGVNGNEKINEKFTVDGGVIEESRWKGEEMAELLEALPQRNLALVINHHGAML